MIIYPETLLRHFETAKGLVLFGNCEVAQDFILWALRENSKDAEWIDVEADAFVEDPAHYLEKGLFADPTQKRFIAVSDIKDRHVKLLKELHKEEIEDCFLYYGQNIKKSSALVRWSQSCGFGSLACYSNTHLPLKKTIYAASLKWLSLEFTQTIWSKIYDTVSLEAWPDMREKLFLLSSEENFCVSSYLKEVASDFSDARNLFVEKKRPSLFSFFSNTVSIQDGLSLVRAFTYFFTCALRLKEACERGTSFEKAFLALKYPPFSEKTLHQRTLYFWSLDGIKKALVAMGQAELMLKQGHPFWFVPLTKSFS